MRFCETHEFQKDLKKLKKKYRSLSNDLKVLEQYLRESPEGHVPAVYPVSFKELNLVIPAYKVKNFRCKSLGGGSRSGIRVIYSYCKEKEAILFIEIYRKEKDNTECNLGRLSQYCEYNWCDDEEFVK